jgi:hypothetical protein
MLDGSVESLVTGDVAEGGDMLGGCFWELYRTRTMIKEQEEGYKGRSGN